MRLFGLLGVLCFVAAPVMAGPEPIAGDSYWVEGLNFPSDYGPNWVTYDGSWDLAGGVSGMYVIESHVDFPGIPGGIITNEGHPSQGTIPEYALPGTGLEVGFKTADGEGINDTPGDPWGFTTDDMDFDEIPIIAHDTIFVYFTVDGVVVDVSAMAILMGFEAGPHPWADPNDVPSVIYPRNPEYDIFHDMKLAMGYWEDGTLGALLGTELTDMHVGMLIIPGPSTLTVEMNKPWGEVVVDPNSATYPVATLVTLEALPVDGKSFKQWQIFDPNYPGDANHAVIDTNNPTTITMPDGDQVVKVTFKCGSGISPMLPMILAALALCAMVRRRRAS